jgi:hypothetical protein
MVQEPIRYDLGDEDAQRLKKLFPELVKKDDDGFYFMATPKGTKTIREALRRGSSTASLEERTQSTANQTGFASLSPRLQFALIFAGFGLLLGVGLQGILEAQTYVELAQRKYVTEIALFEATRNAEAWALFGTPILSGILGYALGYLSELKGRLTE